MNERRAGRFITFEGGEGAGKSTQIARLADWLRGHGIDVVATREPGGAPGAEMIRKLLVEGPPERWEPMTEVLLHYAARRDHLARIVWPSLERGAWVLSDRFADSTMVYQGHAQGIATDDIARLHALVVGDFSPDLTLVLDVPVEAGLARAAARRGGEGRYETFGPAFHQKVRDGFLAIAAAEPQRCVVIDATGEIDAVAEAVRQAVADRFSL
jgi:dTMP kinase